MVHLTLVGVSDDAQRLLLVDDAGEEFSLAVDSRLKAALRGETSRLGQLEITMDSALRPRDIQARIRAGESPEDVALAAQTTVEKIMAFAGPVLAEREHVARRAQASSVRRRGDAQGARTLGEAVEAHLRSQNVDPESIEWDAWRREDGRWTLSARFSTTRREGVASFSYDVPGSYVTVDDDDARWLVGEEVDRPASAERSRPDDLSAVRARRLASVPEDELPLGDDAIELVSDAPAEPAQAAPQPSSDSPVDGPADTPREQPVQGPVDGAAPVAEPTTEPTTEPVADEPAGEPAATDPGEPPGDEPEDDGQPPRRPVQKKRGRASVPSWDEIMFGGRDQ